MTESSQDPASALVEWVRAKLGAIANLIERVVGPLAGPLAWTIAVAGCDAGAGNVPHKPAPAALVKEVPVEPVKEPEGPRLIGNNFDMTFYYVANELEIEAKAKKREAEAAAANDNQAVGDAELAAVASPEMVTLYETKGCEPIADVSREFAFQLRVQGTGKLRDGRVLNIWGNCNCGHSPCFKVIPQQWGRSGSGRALQPFRTVAVDPKLIKLGSLLYVPFLEGRTMPGRPPWGGFVHDGCVVADDVGGGIKGQQLDFFVGRRGWFLGMSGRGSKHAWARRLEVYDGSKLCERNGRRVSRKAGSI